MHSRRADQRPLIWTPSSSVRLRLDPNEDPVSGLARVESMSNLQARDRRRRRANTDDGGEQPSVSSGSQLIAVDAAENHQHTLSEKYESLDYEIVENELYRADELGKLHQFNLFRKTVNRWVVCFFIGVFTACVAAFIDIAVYYIGKLKYQIMISRIADSCNHQTLGSSSCMWILMLAWAAFNCLFVGIAAALVIYMSPVAAGSGIPQIKCFLNGVHIPGVVRLKTLVAKAIGVACSVAGGLAAGKEGPMIHSGAVVAAGVSQGRSFTFSIDLHIFKYFRNDREKRDFVSAGAAAGVSAAFAAPIGGVLFSLEEGASFWNQSLTWRMVFSAMISTFTLNCFLSSFYGKAGILSWNGLANFGVFEDTTYSVAEVPFFALVGVFGGLSGALFNSLNMKLARFRKKYVRSKAQKFFECMLVAAASAFVGFITLLLVDDCQPVGVNPHTTDVNKLWCPKGKYSAVANLFFRNPEESVKSLFHSTINSFRPYTLIIFAIEYFLLTLWTYGLSVPSGIFIPCLLSGAAWGRLIGVMVARLPFMTGVDPGKYALAGAAAQLGGVVRMTISLTAIVVEATKDITFGLPIMLVLMIAKWVGDWFNEGIYDSHINLNEVPVLGWHPPKLSRNILAESVMRKDVVALPIVEQVGRILEILRNTKHHGFPIVDQIDEGPSGTLYPDYGHLKGLILRSQLVVLLKNKNFSYDVAGCQLHSEMTSVALEDFSEHYTKDEKMPTADLGLGRAELQCWIDLRPFLHPSPYRVPLSASLKSIFKLFRGLGLRFLIVVNDKNKVRGVITRKDIARFKERRVKNEYLVNEIYVTPYNN